MQPSGGALDREPEEDWDRTNELVIGGVDMEEVRPRGEHDVSNGGDSPSKLPEVRGLAVDHALQDSRTTEAGLTGTDKSQTGVEYSRELGPTAVGCSVPSQQEDQTGTEAAPGTAIHL